MCTGMCTDMCTNMCIDMSMSRSMNIRTCIWDIFYEWWRYVARHHGHGVSLPGTWPWRVVARHMAMACRCQALWPWRVVPKHMAVACHVHTACMLWRPLHSCCMDITHTHTHTHTHCRRIGGIVIVGHHRSL